MCGNQHGLVCPECGKDDAVRVCAEVIIALVPDGSEVVSDHEFGEGAITLCNACEYHGVIEDFETE